jgi:hypothetical protein
MKILFSVFVLFFSATAVVALLGLTGQVTIEEEFKKPLYYGVIFQIAGVVIAVARSGLIPPEPPKEILGDWWELLHNHKQAKLCFLEIKHPPTQRQLVIDGKAYDRAGKHVADWNSEGMFRKPNTLEWVLFWKGREFAAPQTEVGGIGLFRFVEPADGQAANEGGGWYTPGRDDAPKIAVSLRRMTEEESKVMRAADDSAKQRLAASVWSKWNKGMSGTPLPE